jgi:hypothetical protein
MRFGEKPALLALFYAPEPALLLDSGQIPENCPDAREGGNFLVWQSGIKIGKQESETIWI